MASFDHVVIAVRDPGQTAVRLEARYGLRAHQDGARHPWGTANRVIPLEPPEYLELLHVVDERALAQQDPVLHGVMQRAEHADFLLGWVVRDVDIEQVAQQVGARLSDEEAHGAETSSAWRYVERPDAPLGFPGFIAYRAAEERLSRWRRRYEEAAHPRPPGPLEWVEISGSSGSCQQIVQVVPGLDIRCSEGVPEVRGIGFRSRAQVVALRNADLRP